MTAIKQELLDYQLTLFAAQGVKHVDGTFDYPNGELTFTFVDDVLTQAFVYKGDGKNSYSVSGFKTLLSDTGGKIIQAYNVRYDPDYLGDFLEQVTE